MQRQVIDVGPASQSERAGTEAGRQSNVVRTMPMWPVAFQDVGRRRGQHNKVSRRQKRGASPGADVSTQAPFPDVFFGPFHPPPPASACWLRPHARLRPWSGRASVGALEDPNSRSGARGARANAASLNGRTSRSICSPGRSFHWFFRVSRASVESPAGEPPAAVLRYARQRQCPGVEEN